MSERSAGLLIDDILEAASKIASYTAGRRGKILYPPAWPPMPWFAILKSLVKPLIDCRRNSPINTPKSSGARPAGLYIPNHHPVEAGGSLKLFDRELETLNIRDVPFTLIISRAYS